MYIVVVPILQMRELGTEGPGQPRVAQLVAVEQIQTPGVLLNPLPSCLPEEKIYRFLEARGPCKALIIAKFLGLRTAKEVNPDLYALMAKHLLDHDQNSNTWKIYQQGKPLPAAHTWLGGLVKRNPNTQTLVLAGRPAKHFACSTCQTLPEIFSGLADQSLEGVPKRGRGWGVLLGDIIREDFLEAWPQAAVAEGGEGGKEVAHS